MAFGRPNCIWRRAACDVLDRMNRDYRVLFTSFSATVITAAVLSGLAISVLPECALRPGMRVLGDADGFGALPDCKIGIMRGHTSAAGTRRRAGPPYLRKPGQHLGADRRGKRHVRLRGDGGDAQQAAAAGPGHAGLVNGFFYLKLSEIGVFSAETSILPV